LVDEWPVWRLVTYPGGRIATLEEIERHWNFDDVMRANEALDALEEARPKVTHG
jgi:hypothetical protein